MRMSSLLVGTIMGAAAVMVLARKRPGAIAAVNNAVCDTASAISHKSMDAMDAMRKINWRKEAKKMAPKFSDNEAIGSTINRGIEKIDDALDNNERKKEMVQSKAAELTSQVTH